MARISAHIPSLLNWWAERGAVAREVEAARRQESAEVEPFRSATCSRRQIGVMVPASLCEKPGRYTKRAVS